MKLEDKRFAVLCEFAFNTSFVSLKREAGKKNVNNLLFMGLSRSTFRWKVKELSGWQNCGGFDQKDGKKDYKTKAGN